MIKLSGDSIHNVSIWRHSWDDTSQDTIIPDLPDSGVPVPPIVVERVAILMNEINSRISSHDTNPHLASIYFRLRSFLETSDPGVTNDRRVDIGNSENTQLSKKSSLGSDTVKLLEKLYLRVEKLLIEIEAYPELASFYVKSLEKIGQYIIDIMDSIEGPIGKSMAEWNKSHYNLVASLVMMNHIETMVDKHKRRITVEKEIGKTIQEERLKRNTRILRLVFKKPTGDDLFLSPQQLAKNRSLAKNFYCNDVFSISEAQFEEILVWKGTGDIEEIVGLINEYKQKPEDEALRLGVERALYVYRKKHPDNDISVTPVIQDTKIRILTESGDAITIVPPFHMSDTHTYGYTKEGGVYKRCKFATGSIKIGIDSTIEIMNEKRDIWEGLLIKPLILQKEILQEGEGYVRSVKVADKVITPSSVVTHQTSAPKGSGKESIPPTSEVGIVDLPTNPSNTITPDATTSLKVNLSTKSSNMDSFEKGKSFGLRNYIKAKAGSMLKWFR